VLGSGSAGWNIKVFAGKNMKRERDTVGNMKNEENLEKT
jgi:hypothetical protein